MKTHISFATRDLDASIAFYAALLGRPAEKVLPDYALFINGEPALELSLHLGNEIAPATDAHYGICVESVSDVETAILRLEKAGLVSSIEREQTCCYANQSKVWSVDPDGRRWEVYTVHEDTEDPLTDGASCCGGDADEPSCCAA